MASSNLVEFIFRGNNRSMIRSLNQISEQSKRTEGTIRRDSDASSMSFERLGRSTERLRGQVSGLMGAVGLTGLAFGLKDVVQGGLALQSQQAQLQQAQAKLSSEQAGPTAETIAEAQLAVQNAQSRLQTMLNGPKPATVAEPGPAAAPPLKSWREMREWAASLLLTRIRLTDPRGNPVCARVHPPALTWSAAGA